MENSPSLPESTIWWNKGQMGQVNKATVKLVQPLDQVDIETMVRFGASRIERYRNLLEARSLVLSRIFGGLH